MRSSSENSYEIRGEVNGFFKQLEEPSGKSFLIVEFCIIVLDH